MCASADCLFGVPDTDTKSSTKHRQKVQSQSRAFATHSSHFFTTFACSNSLQKYHMRLSCRTWAKMTKLPGRIRHCYTGYTCSSSSIDQDSSMMLNVPFESLESPHCHVEVPAGKLTNIPKGSKGQIGRLTLGYDAIDAIDAIDEHSN